MGTSKDSFNKAYNGDTSTDTTVEQRSNNKRSSSKSSRTKTTSVQRPPTKPRPQVILDDWQQQVLDWDGDILLKTGRQIGKTFTMSRKAALEMINHPNCHIICCSLTEDQAQLIIVMTLDYLERNYKTYIAKGTKKPTKNKIELTNGSSILARPVGNTGDAVRGFTGDVLILDECSRFAEFIFTAAKPTLLSTGGKIWMCSTPFGKQGYFYECYQNRGGRFKVIEANSWDVVHNRPISEVWTEDRKKKAIDLIEKDKEDMTELQFAQEYLGLFVEQLRQLFSDSWINNVCILQRRQTQILRDKQYFLGVDIARMGEDKSAFEIIDKLNTSKFEQIENITTKKTLTTATYDRILSLDTNYNFKKIGIDAGTGSMGVGLLDFLMRSRVKSKVEPLSNMSRDLDKDGEKKKSLLKEDMYQMMLLLGEANKLKLLDEEEVRTSLRSVQYEYTTEENYSNKVRIFAKPSADIVEALVRAVWLANAKHTTAFIDYI